ncbi:broad substrate specificity ATP-binding cassette transporter ABCG2-like [Paramacrobiotus metropolitanus]|uniref:broad substrate specificity ATP-binding cassette transporter ABCG2-like n=1 Tax=Paramacrobiotus metropolitanus TaxID=2943436 RepID=UPI002445B707|nr:broad substrate specificity ATP-binding cassette transporter ABCG2-like [Paramacrobiotus metropolitanus]
MDDKVEISFGDDAAPAGFAGTGIDNPVYQSETLLHFPDQQTDSSSKPLTLSFHDICFFAKIKKEEKQILDNISGIFCGGLNAILGPTGSGKSSLLDVLAGRKDPQNVSGKVLLDGKATPSDFRLMTGYVVQDDVVMGTLTIRENLSFSAALRLPQSLTSDERNHRVKQVIEELQLQKCADTKVGTELIRGVSGGERKRCNIGMELITSPRILFLDEPTSGLDANTASHVMKILHQMSQSGRTIIFSIHQPRFSIYRMFDTLVLLSAGRVAYHGLAAKSIDYFQENGYEIESHNNPADFFLDVLMGEVERNSQAGPSDEPLELLYARSEIKEEVDRKLASIWSVHQLSGGRSEENSGHRAGYKTSFARQIAIVSGRTVKNLIRNPQTSILQLVIMVVFGAIVGAIYWQVDQSYPAGLQNRYGAFFFIIMNLVFGNLDAVELFVKERRIFVHENASGFYRVSSYFLAKVFCDILPRRTVPTLIFCSIAYFMIGFQTDAAKCFIFALTMLSVAFAGASLAFLFSASVNVFAIGNLMIALCYVFMMLFSGFMVNIGTVLSWLQWIKWLSFFRYAMSAVSINELHGMEFYCSPGQNVTTICATGDQYLQQQNIKFDVPWDLWQNIVALASMALILLFLAYVQLRRIKKLR